MMPFAKLPGLLMLRLGFAAMGSVAIANAIASPSYPQSDNGYSAEAGRSLMLRADIQEADAKTGIVTARGNVQIDYPARQMQATAAQAQYFSRERRIVLSGDVYILQQGNSLRGETVTYLIDEGRFIALPKNNRQVESIYVVPESKISPPGAQTRPAAPSF